MSKTVLPRRRGRSARVASALFVLLAVTAYLVFRMATDRGGSPLCTVRAGSSSPSYTLTPEQAGNAATISAVGTARGLSERAVTIALATALQESGLRNLRHGDRDSLGLFQQRPSKGWGTPVQILDPVYSAGTFFSHLVKVPGYTRLPLTVAAQSVQHSAFPLAYAKQEPDATLLASSLTGNSPASLTCTTPKGLGAGSPGTVRTALVRDFGPGVRPVVTTAGLGAGEQADEVSVPVVNRTAGSLGASRRGWSLALWAVARSSDLRIGTVSYAGMEWSAKDARQGWQPATPRSHTGPGAAKTNAASPAHPADSGQVLITTIA